mgnify:FL=1
MKKFISLAVAAVCLISSAQAASLPEGRTGYIFDFSESTGVNLNKFTKKDAEGTVTRIAQITDGALEMTSNAGDGTVSSFVQLSGSQVFCIWKTIL